MSPKAVSSGDMVNYMGLSSTIHLLAVLSSVKDFKFSFLPLVVVSVLTFKIIFGLF